MNLAAVFDDGLRHVGDESAEEVEKARLAETLGGRSRCCEIDEQQRALLAPRTMIASHHEGNEDAWPEQFGHAEHKVSGEGHGEPEGDVADGDRLRAVEQPDDKSLDHNDDGEIGGRAKAEIDEEREPAKVRSDASLEPKSLQRRDSGAEDGAERNAGPPGVMHEIGIDPPDDGADDGARHDKAKEDGVRHLRRRDPAAPRLKAGFRRRGARAKALSAPGVKPNNRSHPVVGRPPQAARDSADSAAITWSIPSEGMRKRPT